MENTNPTAADLQKQLNKANEKTDLKALAQLAISCLAEAEKGGDNSDLQAQLDEALEQVKELGEKLDKQEQTKDLPGILVSVKDADGNKMDRILIGKSFNRKGVKYSAKDIAADQDYLDHLHSIGSGSLVHPDELKQPEAETESA